MHNKYTELAWAAGFFDGEGHVRCNVGGRIALTIAQIDPTVLIRFQSAMGGLGKLYGPYKQKVPNGHEYWQYSVNGFVKVQQVLVLLWSYLSLVKREQFRVAMLRARVPAKSWEKCAALQHRIGRAIMRKKTRPEYIFFYCKTCHAARQSRINQSKRT